MNIFIIPKLSSCLLITPVSHPSPYPIPFSCPYSPGKHWSAPVTRNQCAFCRILYNWNHTECTFFGLASLTQYNYLKDSSTLLHVSIVYSFYFGVVFHGDDIPQLTFPFTCWDLCVVSSFGLLQIKLWTFVYESLCGLQISSLLDKYIAV